MKTLGRGSLASCLKALIDVVYFLSFLPAVLLVVLAVLIPFFADSTHLTVHPRVLLQLRPEVFAVLPGESGPVPDVTIERAVADLAVEGVSAGRMALGLAWAGVLWVFLFLALRQLRAIFRTLKEGHPFVPENARRIRFLGIAAIAFELLYRGSIFWMYFAFVANRFGISGVRLRPLFDPAWGAILAGLVLLVISEVFRVGAEMKAEQELTV